jgi:hypothetical protein
MENYRVEFQRHAAMRMEERKVGEEEVLLALSVGQTIKVYSDDLSYPSELILCWSGSRPIHVVVATNSVDRVKLIITVYEPDPNQWDNDFRRRKP